MYKPAPAKPSKAMQRCSPTPLAGSRFEVAIRGMTAETMLVQTYENREATNIEAVYTFPLPIDATFLGVDLSRGERQMRGVVVARTEGTRRYEEALEDGNSALLFENPRPGMYVLNLGNLMPGERVEMTIRFAQWLAWNDDTVCFVLPTTIAPRYGRFDIEPHQVPEVDLLAAHRYQAAITVEGLLAAATLTSPSHRVSTSHAGDRTSISVADAFLDRDLVLRFKSSNGFRQDATVVPDGDGSIAILSFVPDIDFDAGQPVACTLVVDCSSSMAGDSIGQTRVAVARILRALGPADRVNILRFGSSREVLLRRPSRMTQIVRDALEEATAGLEADLGGTELIAALEAALDDLDRVDRKEGLARTIFLISDGEVADPELDQVLRRCNATGTRVFAVGVGSAAAEAVLRPLADGTRGAIERVYPGENMADRITRHFDRARAPLTTITAVEWPTSPEWVVQPTSLTPGDTAYIVAGFSKLANGAAIVHASQPGSRHKLMAFQCSAISSSSVPTNVSRLGAAARMPRLASADAARWAERYQLLSAGTSCVIVEQRVGAAQAESLPELRRVKQMLAAGWGGTASLAGCEVLFLARQDCEPLSRSVSKRYAVDYAAPPTSVDDYLDIPAFLSPSEDADCGYPTIGIDLGPDGIARGEVLSEPIWQSDAVPVPTALIEQIASDLLRCSDDITIAVDEISVLVASWRSNADVNLRNACDLAAHHIGGADAMSWAWIAMMRVLAGIPAGGSIKASHLDSIISLLDRNARVKIDEAESIIEELLAEDLRNWIAPRPDKKAFR